MICAVLGIIEKNLSVIKKQEDKEWFEEIIEGEMYSTTNWKNYSLISEPKKSIYRPWRKLPFKSMFEASKWEFQGKEGAGIRSATFLSEQAIGIGDSYYNLLEVFNKFEMRQEGGEWQPCGEKHDE